MKPSGTPVPGTPETGPSGPGFSLPPADPAQQRLTLGVAYRGTAYHGWQSQPDGRTVQDVLELALCRFCQSTRAHPVCGPHRHRRARAEPGGALRHAAAARTLFVGCGAPIPTCRPTWPCSGASLCRPTSMPATWHAAGATSTCCCSHPCARRWNTGWWAGCSVNWTVPPCNKRPMCCWVNTTSARFVLPPARPCRRSKTLHHLNVSRRGAYWAFDFEGSAFLHHMVRNIMGCLVAVGSGQHPPAWLADVLAARSRDAAAAHLQRGGLVLSGSGLRCGFWPAYPGACFAVVAGRLCCMNIRHDRTRIKICGFTRPADVDAAVAAGADASGLQSVGRQCAPCGPGPRGAVVRALAALRDARAAVCQRHRRRGAAWPLRACRKRCCSFTATKHRRSAKAPAAPTCAPRAWRRVLIC